MHYMARAELDKTLLDHIVTIPSQFKTPSKDNRHCRSKTLKIFQKGEEKTKKND